MLYFLMQLREFNLPQERLVTFNTHIIQSDLCNLHHCLVRVLPPDKTTIETVERIIGTDLPSIHRLYMSRTKAWTSDIAADRSHPGDKLLHTSPVVNVAEHCPPKRAEARSACSLRLCSLNKTFNYHWTMLIALLTCLHC